MYILYIENFTFTTYYFSYLISEFEQSSKVPHPKLAGPGSCFFIPLGILFI
jgi:hypothetical protein